MSPRSAAVATAAAALLLAPTAAAARQAPLARLAGQTIVTGMDGRTPGPRLLARIRAGEVGGVILFARNIGSRAQVRALVERLQRAAAAGGNPPLLVAVDQEGGSVRRFANGPPDSAPAELGGLAEAARQGAATGRFLRGLGVDVDLAPVLDTPVAGSFLGSRAFSSDPRVNAWRGRAFVGGLQSQRVAATAKHFPGLGTARETTDRARVVIRATRAELERRLLPFRAAIRRGVRLVMVSNAAYPAYGHPVPAVLSPAVVKGLLRGRLGFRGVVVSDAMEAPGPAAVPDAPVRALAAGVDLLLYTSERTSAAGYERLLAAAREGRLPRATLEQAAARIASLKRWLAGRAAG